MGYFKVSALSGAIGLLLAASCGGTDATLVDEGERAPAQRENAPQSRQASPEVDKDAGAVGDDAGDEEDAATSESDASVDASTSDASADASGPPPKMFELPGQLVKDVTTQTECWSGPIIVGTDCKDVPVTDPPVFRENDACGPESWPSILVRVPPHTCARFTAQHKVSSACTPSGTAIPTTCSKVTNATDEDMWTPVNYKRVIVRWEDETVCPYFDCD